MFGFRTRNPQRDRDSDRSRQRRLSELMDEILAEIRAERLGIETRYRAETEQAGFLAEALANDRAEPADWNRVDQLTVSIIGYEKRMAALARQIELLEECRRRMARLAESATDDP